MLSPQQPINTFSVHTRRIYGTPIGKIPIDAGLTCPNRAQGGCIFCRPASFTPGYLTEHASISRQVTAGKLSVLRQRFTRYFAYFQQETCTALPASELLAAIETVLADSACVGLIISTRPDYVADELLGKLSELIIHTGKECLFELGMQSAHDPSLALLNRNHSFGDTCDALARIRAAGPFSTGVHLLFGIPGETEDEMLESVRAAAGLGVDAVKLHHLQVIRGTVLEKMHDAGQVIPFTLDGYMSFLVKALSLLPARVVVHRLWATSHPDVLIAPRWHILTDRLRPELDRRLKLAGVIQGKTHLS